jgi:hypothetical protein
MVTVACRLRVYAGDDLETRTTTEVLRSLGRRSATLGAEAKVHEKSIREVVRRWRPDTCSTNRVSARSWPPPFCAPGPTRAAVGMKVPSPNSAGSLPSRRRRAWRPVTDSTATAIASSTGHSTPSCCADFATTQTPGPTPKPGRRKSSHPGRSSGVSSAVSLASSFGNWRTRRCHLTLHGASLPERPMAEDCGGLRLPMPSWGVVLLTACLIFGTTAVVLSWPNTDIKTGCRGSRFANLAPLDARGSCTAPLAQVHSVIWR